MKSDEEHTRAAFGTGPEDAAPNPLFWFRAILKEPVFILFSKYTNGLFIVVSPLKLVKQNILVKRKIS